MGTFKVRTHQSIASEDDQGKTLNAKDYFSKTDFNIVLIDGSCCSSNKTIKTGRV